jgi:hypothetical protein
MMKLTDLTASSTLRIAERAGVTEQIGEDAGRQKPEVLGGRLFRGRANATRF